MLDCPVCKGGSYSEDGTRYCENCDGYGAFPKIVESAITQDGKIYTGRRHHNVIADMVNTHKLPIPIKGEQGFVDENGKFLDRLEGADLALKSGQIQKLSWPPNLYSEDLW